MTQSGAPRSAHLWAVGVREYDVLVLTQLSDAIHLPSAGRRGGTGEGMGTVVGERMGCDDSREGRDVIPMGGEARG